MSRDQLRKNGKKLEQLEGYERLRKSFDFNLRTPWKITTVGYEIFVNDESSRDGLISWVESEIERLKNELELSNE